MHETRFINEIFAVLKQKVNKDMASGQVVVNARLSPFSHVTIESLQESFKELIKRGNFDNVWLNVLPLEILLECKNCKHSNRITQKVFSCPFCGSADINVQMDKEFFVESIEIGHKEKETENGD